jgi:hypothetical protein
MKNEEGYPMKTLYALVCSGNMLTEMEMAQDLTQQGVTAQTSHEILDGLYATPADWDFIFVDLNGLDKFVCSILPVVRRRMPHLPAIGIRTQSTFDDHASLACGIELDAYLSEIPQPEELIMNFPQVITRRKAELAL